MSTSRSAFAGVLFITVSVVAACGKAADDGEDDQGSGGAGAAGKGGTGGTGGSVASGGSAGTSAATGGTDSGGRGGSTGSGGSMMCAEWTLEHPEPCFTPCGGDPIGQWRLEESCDRHAIGTLGGCQSIHRGTGSPDLTMEFKEGGFWTLLGDEGRQNQQIILDAACPSGCPDELREPGILAFRESGYRLFCEESACGECVCDDSFAYPSFGRGKWFSDGSDYLNFNDIADRYGLTLEYCVTGDEMWLGHLEVGTSYRFVRAACGGNPLPCAERDPESCVLGGRCSLGACQAADEADAETCAQLSETTCGTISGCSWLANACIGVVAYDCTFDTCGQPGCSMVDADTPCIGTTVTCEERSLEDCTRGVGCRNGLCSLENGSATYPCNVLTSSTCEYVVGCTPTVAGECVGDYTCADQPAYSCSFTPCDWIPATSCTGEAATCDSLAPAQCQTQLGCMLDTN